MGLLQTKKLTTGELAVELKRTPETLRRWRRDGSGPPFIRLQGRVLYDRADVESWLRQQRTTPATGEAQA